MTALTLSITRRTLSTPLSSRIEAAGVSSYTVYNHAPGHDVPWARFWFSVADSDVLLWAGGIARGLGLDVAVHEPNIWPLAIQGPLAEEVAAAVFGEQVRNVKFFRIATLAFAGNR